MHNAVVWVWLAAFCCGVLANLAARCILVLMPLQCSDAFVEADEAGADTWIQDFLQTFLVAFFVHLQGDPFTTSVLRYGLAWCCYWVTDRHSLFAGGWHTPNKTKQNNGSKIANSGRKSASIKDPHKWGGPLLCGRQPKAASFMQAGFRPEFGVLLLSI